MKPVELVITTALALLGFYLVHSFRRQQRLRIGEQRIDAYRKLWERMYVARPSRLRAPEQAGPLERGEAADLHGEMTKWYFENGSGMLLRHTTRRMYLEAKDRLGRYAAHRPEPDDDADPEDATGRVMPPGELRIRELSLLRSQMKRDLDIYGVFWFQTEVQHDKRFLERCGLDPGRWDQPWYRRLGLPIRPR